MYPAPFAYHRPETIREALELLGELGEDAKLLAGGHSLVPSMKVRMIRPDHLIDLGGIRELRGISCEQGALRIGATTRHRDVASSDLVEARQPLLHELANVIADPQVRNRGTMGGSICNADPAADLPAAVLVLDADLRCVDLQGERVVGAADWFQGLFTTDLREGEILLDVVFPEPPPGSGTAYVKLRHPASRYAVVGVAAILTADSGGRCVEARVAITGIGTCAARVPTLEAKLAGETLTRALIAEVAETACDGFEINSDMHFRVEDRRELCQVYVERALGLAWQRLGSSA